jgi:hypothetical protein
VSLLESVKSVEQHFADFLASAREQMEQHLPEIGQVAEQAAGNPALAALLGAVHLPQAPALLQALASTINEIEAGLKAAHEAGQAAAPPAEPAA